VPPGIVNEHPRRNLPGPGQELRYGGTAELAEAPGHAQLHLLAQVGSVAAMAYLAQHQRPYEGAQLAKQRIPGRRVTGPCPVQQRSQSVRVLHGLTMKKKTED
jgi:hypothetical protein